MTAEIRTLSEEEALDQGLSTSFTNGADPDNPMFELDNESGLPPTDNEGRAVISWRQYQKLRNNPQPFRRLDNYALRVMAQSKQGPVSKTVQASKLLKWWGLGYRPVGYKEATKQKVNPAPKRPVEAVADTPKVYFCADAYPDCPRFFDTQPGLTFHIKKVHTAAMKPRKARKAAEPAAEE
jgi:hypothetical protein